ncbi:MAG TPA: UbiA family prenyltransferase [Ktedonobacterales bacterium]|jgi:4-hydroxybenzoate polyprenyltransferase
MNGTAPPAPPATSPRGLIARRVRGIVLVTHPLPSLAYVIAVGGFAVVAALAARRGLDAGTLLRVLLAVAGAQAAIGATNDLFDLPLDAASQPGKPLVRGLITPDHALLVALVGSAALLLLIAPLGLLALALGLLIEGLGLAYDFGLKRTPWSGLLFAVYFPLIPLLAWAVFGRWQPFLPWLVPVGAALGITMNVANSLPDLEGDVAHGVRGLPHLLGPRRGLLVAWITPLAVAALLWLLNLTGLVPAHVLDLGLATGFALLSVASAYLLYQARPTPETLRTTFYIQMLGVVAMAIAWLAAVAF